MNTKMVAVRLARRRIGRLMRRGGLIALPAPRYFGVLQQLALTNKLDSHRHVLMPGLAHFAFTHDAAARSFAAHLLTFVESTRRISGLEGLFLSCMQDAQNTGHQSLVAAGAAAWRSFGPHRADHPRNSAHLLVYDRALNVLTAVAAKHTTELYKAVAKDGFRAGSMASFVRNLGHDAAAPTTGPLNIPFGAADDRDHCKDRTNTIVQIGGALLGVAVGAIVSSQLSGADNNLGNQLGAWGLSLSGGVVLGQTFAPLIATYGCKNDGTPGNSSDDVAVSTLVAGVQSGAITLDQALQIAGGMGGEATAPSTSGSSDSMLNNSFDPYFDISPTDLLDDAGQTPASGTQGENDKPDNVDQETWDLVNYLTQPDSSGSTGSSDTSGAGGTSSGGDGTSTGTGSGGDTGTGGPPPDPSGIPNPDGDGRGGGPFGIGPLGPWVAGFDPEGGSGSSPGSPKKPKGGQLSLPNPEGGGPQGPFALPNGSVFIPAPSVFGRGAIGIGGIVRSIAIEGSNGTTASCIIVGMPRLNPNGSLGTAGFLQQRGGGGV